MNTATTTTPVTTATNTPAVTTTSTTRARRCALRSLVVVVAAAALGTASPALGAPKPKKSPAKKTAVKPAAVKPAAASATAQGAPTSAGAPRTVELNRCSYAADDVMSGLLGVSVTLDTSPGDAGSNTHAISAKFEQCVFNVTGSAPGDAGRLRAILHVQRDAARVFQDFAEGRFNGPCPTGCISLSGLGTRALLSARYGDGGGFTDGAFAFISALKGSTQVFVALAPANPAANNGHEYDQPSQIEPAQVELATKITQHLLSQV